ncbi:MAG: hypothetical protein MUE97_02220 [Phycisphaerales bacterium]|nr:hypothetical protein [Phycisphaerales bacterium]
MATSGFDRFESHFFRAPSIVVHWNDDRTCAQGWMCIDELRGNAAGGGTRMHEIGTREEAIFLAKTMGVKFRVCGPAIGGGKSVLRYDHRAKDKKDVLHRWYTHIAPYLRHHYGTGGDVGVDEVVDATLAIEATTGLKHPQAGIIIGHFAQDAKATQQAIARMRAGVEAKVSDGKLPATPTGQKHWHAADVATGAGVVRSIEAYAKTRKIDLAGKRVVIEGFGAVGAFAGHYLAQLGAIVIGASTAGDKPGTLRLAIDEKGLDVDALVTATFANGRRLPAAGHAAYRKTATVRDVKPAKSTMLLELEHGADIFVPAAASHTIGKAQLKALAKAGISLWACGANNPFDHGYARGEAMTDYPAAVKHMLRLMKDADDRFAIIPDFVANSGMARAFAYLMEPTSTPTADAVLTDVRTSMDRAVATLLDGHRPGKKRDKGLLSRGYEAFLA